MTFETLLAEPDLYGAKVAAWCGGEILCYQRDDFAHIPDPGLWDLPGGVRETGETLLDCAIRETWEEFGIALPQDAFGDAARFVKFEPHRIEALFLTARLTPPMVAAITFGEEGQQWRMMPVAEFVTRPDAVRELQSCVATWWEGMG
ncbi:NUDIX domain-containing protein [Tropicimonas sp. IMCC6043]|uniref:NUDIX domain-containing protein n=1 Tax=Tropicimonas sp. IMCC6043 TaxID=2510645 RepID=UPI00101DA88D|nr:NUDIX hydrolase [Tropicimonas sp. IMCC6043]RYH06402.1 NUDIX domain-containing protein [Tropicimonas sp. IMCC6043]